MFYARFCKVVILLLISNSAFTIGVPDVATRITGGTLANINTWPYMTALLQAQQGLAYSQYCAGSILTTTAVLSAAQCLNGRYVGQCRVRVGSSWANSGGTVHTVRQIKIHTKFNSNSLDSDIAVLKTTTSIEYGSVVQPASIAGTGYALGDNQAVWAIGWGYTSPGGSSSEQLRQVQIWTVNQATCRNRYAELGMTFTDNMLCSGWLDVGGRDQCQGDSGGPLIHNNIIVGVCSWGHQCAMARYPGVNTRVSRYTSWIQAAAA